MTKKKETWKRYVSALPALTMMVVIFAFSAKTAVESTQNSNWVVDLLMKMIEGVAGPIQTNREQWYEILVVIVRKGAHMTEYALLCLLVALHLSTWRLRFGTLCAAAVGICALYAASDEVHQLFVAGRTGKATDVLIDTTGALIAVACMALVRACSVRVQRKNDQMN